MSELSWPPQPTVLIADDNAQNLELLQAMVETLPVTIETACDGVETLDHVTQRPPDLILLDAAMPRLSGYDVCRTLKADPATCDIPVLIITALNDTRDAETARESGADDFVKKPVTRVDLVARVKVLLGLA